jgi:uncharacterized protein YjiS (DUF1127 family)
MPAHTQNDSFLGRILAAIKDRSERRRSLEIVDQLDDRILNDIGATRDQLRSAILNGEFSRASQSRASVNFVHGAV